MKSKTSSRPQRRLTKLGKDKPVPAEGIYQPTQAQYDDLPVRASYESLVLSSESRQQLREQLTATFPEVVSPKESSSRWSSRDRLTMGRKDKKTSSNDVEEPSSPTLSFHTARARLSTLPEGNIDVEAAISLLQELKKKASPEELVALHRALLPVKEETYEHDHATASEYRKQFASRRRSNLPPGLATRGGAEDDPLRRYGEITRRPLSQAAEVTPFVFKAGPERSVTPDPNHGQAGVYRSGTLRITNASESPTSSMHFRDSFEIQEAKEVTMLQTIVTPIEYSSNSDIHDDISSDDISLAPHSDDTPPTPVLGPTNLMDEYSQFSGSPYDRKVSQLSQQTDSSGSDSIEQQFVTPKASMADLPKRNDLLVPHLQIPTRPDLGHSDSGYASEASIVPAVAREENKTPVKTGLSEQRWLTALPDVDADARSTTHSLYTFGQMLDRPVTIAHMSTEQSPSPNAGKSGRRHGIFSSLGLSRSQSTKALTDHETSRDSTPIDEIKPTKKAKARKLKKPVPAHIKQARRELKRFEEVAEAESKASIKTVHRSGEVEDLPPIEPIGDSFKVRAPHAYARIMAAGSATQQTRRSSADQPQDRKASVSSVSAEQTRDVQSALSNATSDDTDGNSIINFRAVARSLGASPYDISTSQFKSSIDYIAGSEDRWRIQSPFEIGQGIPGPRTLGMDEKAASELARKKSKDYVASDQSSSRPHERRRPFSTNGQNLPPMPNLPQRFEAKKAVSCIIVPIPTIQVSTEEPVSPIEEQMAMPVEQAPAPASAPAVDWTAQAELWRARRQALQDAESSDSSDEEQGEVEVLDTAEPLQLAEKVPVPSIQQHQLSGPQQFLAARGLHYPGSEVAQHSPATTADQDRSFAIVNRLEPLAQAVQASPLLTDHSPPAQAVQASPLPTDHSPPAQAVQASSLPTAHSPPAQAVQSNSFQAEHSPQSSSPWQSLVRHIEPQERRPTFASIERAQTRTPVRRPVGSGPRSMSGSKDAALSIETARAASVSPAQTTLNNARAAIQDRIGSPVSPIGKGRLEVEARQRPQSQISERAVSPILSTVQAPRGPRPPSVTSLANTNGRFSADYLAKLNGITDVVQTPPSRPQSAALATPDRLATPERVAIAQDRSSVALDRLATPGLLDTPDRLATPDRSKTPDRYSGGLQYEWQRGVGIGGSAGTRANVSEGVERSMPAKVVYGLDLSDVPVFLTKQV